MEMDEHIFECPTGKHQIMNILPQWTEDVLGWSDAENIFQIILSFFPSGVCFFFFFLNDQQFFYCFFAR